MCTCCMLTVLRIKPYTSSTLHLDGITRLTAAALCTMHACTNR
jgi:hypothetical protein